MIRPFPSRALRILATGIGAVALLGDPAGPVELAGLVPTWDEAKVGAGCPRPLEPTRFIDGGANIVA